MWSILGFFIESSETLRLGKRLRLLNSYFIDHSISSSSRSISFTWLPFLLNRPLVFKQDALVLLVLLFIAFNGRERDLLANPEVPLGVAVEDKVKERELQS